MNKTKIEWCDMTWNPVTGCLHECEYCYARKMAYRFREHDPYTGSYDAHIIPIEFNVRHYLLEIGKIGCRHENEKILYPNGFDPTFHRYRLDEPSQIKKSQNVFVCSMADLFGEWVPDEWIERVFEACEAAPQHRYLFLTKNPKRYLDLYTKCVPDEKLWFGTSITGNTTVFPSSKSHNFFLSIEPLLTPMRFLDLEGIRWVIIGAETGNRKGKVIPKREWIENIVNYCREKNVPVFMKDSLADIWKLPLIQEYPWRDKWDELEL